MLPLFLSTQTALALAIFFATFAYEDGATVLAATLSAAGRLDLRLGLASAFGGIWLGDIGLYALGFGFGRRTMQSKWLQRFLSADKLAKAEAWFSRRGAAALVLSRFVPGSRLPLYVAAGAIRTPFKQFVAITGITSTFWVIGIFAFTHLVPESPLSDFTMMRVWLPLLLVLFIPWLLAKPAARIYRRVGMLYRKYRRWEFWPAWLFYPPVAAMCAWLGFRYRGFSLPTVANPSFHNGGIVGEPKVEVIQALMRIAPDVVADAYPIPAGEISERQQHLQQIRAEHSIPYPFVLKPNVGQRGAGFKLVSSAVQAEQYLGQVAAGLVVQRYINDPKEIGIFYYRFPAWRQGKIFAITEKIFPFVTGDGARTFEELLEDDPRASLIARTYLDRFPQLRGRVLAANERIRLVEAGNHCQGCIFRDGGHLISPELTERIDQISQSLPGFFIGRYDIRYSSDDDLRCGTNFRIIELNGAASEATNIYDERNSLLCAYRTLFKQWELVYAIGHANRELGHRPASVGKVWKDWKFYQAISATYPAAD